MKFHPLASTLKPFMATFVVSGNARMKGKLCRNANGV
jgi:hypothetical protein